jgi:methionyl-tRNA formyltransferase
MRKWKNPVSSKTKLVFFGNERLATGIGTDAPTLRALVAAGYDIAAVVTSHTEGVSRSKKPLEIAAAAHAYHIPVLMSENLSRAADKLRETGARAGVLVAFGKIVPPEILDIFPAGIINIHPSLLPKLRGSTPVETAILNGLEETGVSLMHLLPEMDAGPVYAQKKIDLKGSETKPELAQKLLDAGSKLLLENLDDILSGALEPKIQDETEATYSRLLSKADGHIDFNEPAEDVERKVRAFLGFPRTRAKIHGHDAVITKARVAESEHDGALVMKCQPGYLEILELTAPSGRTMSGADFIRGYRK